MLFARLLKLQEVGTLPVWEGHCPSIPLSFRVAREKEKKKFFFKLKTKVERRLVRERPKEVVRLGRIGVGHWATFPLIPKGE